MRSPMLHVATLAVALALGCTSASKSGPQSAAVAAGSGALPPTTEMGTIDGKVITYADLIAEKDVGTQFKQAESKAEQDLYDVRKKAVDQVITHRLLEFQAKAAHKELDDWFQHDFLNSVPEPSDAEVKASFDEHKAQLPPNSDYEQLKPKITQFVKQEHGKKALAAMLDDLKAKHNARVTFPAPALPRVDVAAIGPSKGPANAPVTIVEFSDFQCPFCGRAAPTVDRVMKEYDGKVKLVFRNYPLEFHPMAEKAAEAGACAADQNKFWEMHDAMFKDQAKLMVPDLKLTARAIGLDGDKFDKCLDSGEKKKAIEADQKAGTDAGVNGTPAFFINGVFLNGAVPFDDFKEALDRELGKKS